MSYLNYTWAHQKLEDVWLLKKIEKYRYELTSFWYISEDDVWCYVPNLIEIATQESLQIARKIEEILENRSDYSWKIWVWEDYQPSLFQEMNLYGNYKNELEIESKTLELMFVTGANISEVIWIEWIRNYKNFWFSTLLDFILASEIAIHQMQHNRYFKKMYSFKRNGFQTQIWGSEHGDLRIFQSDIHEYNVLSPFGHISQSRPTLEKIVSGYHSVEVMFLSTLLQYARQIWYQIKLNDFTDFSKDYGSQAGNFWEMWGDNFHDKMNLEIAFMKPIAQMNQQNSLHHIPTAPGNNFHYFIALKWENLIIWIDENNIKAEFSPEDIPDLIKWIIVQCAHGLGRTSKKRIMDVLEYYFSKEFEEELKK